MKKNTFIKFACLMVVLSITLFLGGCGGTSTSANTTGAAAAAGEVFVHVLGENPQGRGSLLTSRNNYVPLSGVRVSLLGYNLYATTDSNGYATITNVPAGTYTVTVGKDGYQATIYSSITVNNGEATQVGSSAGVQIPTSTAPYILDLSTLSGSEGVGVTITGSNFGSSQGTSSVKFNGTSATTITNWSSTQIVCKVPTGATTGSLIVTVDSQASNEVTFMVSSGSSPSITNLNPTSGSAGTSVTITGTNFGSSQGSSTVKFNGTAAATTSWSATQIICTVPAGATSGNVIVNVNGTASNSSAFTVTSSEVFAVTYNGNDNTGGSVPVDSGSYAQGDTVTVLGNTGNLAKNGYTFAGWNTQANGSGTNYAASSTFTMSSSNVTLYAKWTAGYSLRDTGPAGGLIFYVAADDSAGWQYMEAAPSDQSTGIAWSSTYASITTGSYIGAGKTNTDSIVTYYGAGASYAAGLCKAQTIGDYNDWFLPSKEELYKMYRNLSSGIDENGVIYTPVGDFAVGGSAYWCSSSGAADGAWKTWFATGSSYHVDKYATNYVRAARRF